ncbi:MAG: hypothetical protein RLZZ555_16 [Pseudomonadota bacterium]
MLRLKNALKTLALALSVAGLFTACSDEANELAASVADPAMSFNRVATFAVCEQIGSSCESNEETAAEIAAASVDGMTVIYTNSPKREIGFVDITDPANPLPLGALAMGGEPTSVAVLGAYAVVAVNTKPGVADEFSSPAGKLVVVDIAKRQVVKELALGGQPDSVAVSKDGRYIAVVIENQRDEGINGGALPQTQPGLLMIVDSVGTPDTWKTRPVALTGLATLYPTDPEPEYVSINDDNIAAVTLQENNHVVLVDLKSGAVTGHFSAGSVTLKQVDLTDERPNKIALSETQADRLREPDGIAWLSRTRFAIANEGDLNGGSRSFSILNTQGQVEYDSGAELEHLAVRLGHFNDRRSDAKGTEPENVAFARFDKTDYLFVALERASLLAVYDLSVPTKPVLKQALPGAISPEGILTIPSRGLVISASEVDDRGLPARAALNIYAYQKAAASYPKIVSDDRADGTPIPWAALSGMAALDDKTVYAVDDSFFRGNRILELDVSVAPAVIRREILIKDSNDVFKNFGLTLPAAKDSQAFDLTDVTAMINADKSVNIDPEGVALASGGGFWVASEGAGSKTTYETKRDILSANLIFKVAANGDIQEVIALPETVNGAQQARYGLEGVAEHAGKLVVAIQRSWDPLNKAGNPGIGVYDLSAKTWMFLSYPIDPVSSPNGGWVGLSEITAIGSNQYLVVERDNQMGPDARIKRLYKIDLTGKANGDLLSKTLVRDLLPDLKATKGLVLEKIEGLALLPNGEVMFSTDNDGVNDHGGGGETQLIRLGKILN